MAAQTRIYLDYSATTPVDPFVLEAMLPYFTQEFGNPASIHRAGQRAESALESARETIATVLNCSPSEVIFTSGGTESNNLALRGAAFAARQQRNASHILTSPVEHHAVSRTAEQLAQLHGFELEYLPIDRYGRVDPADVTKAIRPHTAVVSIMYANNEIGSINPIADIAVVCRQAGVPFHTDAVQAGAYCPLDVQSLNVDMLSVGAHKFYGPKGVGALFIRKGTAVVPVQTGGSQEFGLRAGTSNIPYIVGMAAALELVQQHSTGWQQQLVPLRDRLIESVLAAIPDSRLTGHPSQRLPNHASFIFRLANGNNLLMLLDAENFACSSGSACKTGDPEPSDVLTALGLPPEWALGSLRVSLGKENTSEHIDAFLSVLPRLVERARSLPVN